LEAALDNLLAAITMVAAFFVRDTPETVFWAALWWLSWSLECSSMDEGLGGGGHGEGGGEGKGKSLHGKGKRTGDATRQPVFNECGVDTSC